MCGSKAHASRGRPYWQHGYRARVANHNYTTVSDDNQLLNHNELLIQLLELSNCATVALLGGVELGQKPAVTCARLDAVERSMVTGLDSCDGSIERTGWSTTRLSSKL